MTRPRGRPRLAPVTQRVSVTMPAPLIRDALRDAGGLSLSKRIRTLVQRGLDVERRERRQSGEDVRP